MTVKIKPSNAVVIAIQEAAALYHVPCFRMQSGAMLVGESGPKRPMFFGGWRDDLGVLHASGMADLLLQPRVSVSSVIAPYVPNHDTQLMITVPLWVECKARTGKLRESQIAFRDYVVKYGAFFLEAHDSADAIIEWFQRFKVTR